MLAKDADLNYTDKNGGFCIRLYDKNGEHKGSLLSCGISENGEVNCWDLTSPDGKVICCNIDNDIVDGMQELGLVLEPINVTTE